MDYSFNWQADLPSEDRTLFEQKIREDLRSDHAPPMNCHPGSRQIAIGSSDPLATRLVGNISCSCGKKVGFFSATHDASSVQLTSLNA